MTSEFLPLIDFSKVKKKRKGKINKDIIEQEEDDLDDTLIKKTIKKDEKVDKNDKDEKEEQSESNYIENKHYEELLIRIFDLMKAESSNALETLKIPPIQLKQRSKTKNSWVNMKQIADVLNRDVNQVFEFILRELGVQGTKGGEDQCNFKSLVSAKQIESVIHKYVNEFVKCPNCKSTKTIIKRDVSARLDKVVCSACKSEKFIQNKKKK